MKTLKKNVGILRFHFLKTENTREKRIEFTDLMPIFGHFGADTTRKSMSLTFLRADTSRELGSFDQKSVFFQTFLQKGTLFQFCEGDLEFKVVQNVDFGHFQRFWRIQISIFCVQIPFARDP